MKPYPSEFTERTGKNMKKETGSDAGGYDLNPKKGYLPHNDALKPKQRPGR